MKRRSQPTFARNQTELASILDVDRSTIARWMRVPGNPGRRADGRLPVAEWERWAKAHSRLPIGRDAREMRDRLLSAQIATVEHKLAVSQRAHIPVEEVDRLAAKLSAAIRREVKRLHHIAGALENKTAVESERILRTEEHALLTRLQKAAEGIGR
jgi:hypothetical protein